MFYFTKMQATGNDFIILNYINEKLQYSYKLLVKYLCDRHFGIGADGVIILENSMVADYKMRIFNQDGSEANMCGNGIRCLAKYIYEKKLINKNEIKIETLSGIKKLLLEIEGETVIKIKVNMGFPIFDKSRIPMIYEKDANKVKIENIDFYPMSIGNPHCVCFVDDLEKFDVKKYGKIVENYKYFTEGTNVEFVEIVHKNEYKDFNRDTIKVRVWERGVGETLSCGTGACASAIISYKFMGLKEKIDAELLGGKLEIEYDKEKNNVYLSGNAEFVFEGKLFGYSF